MRIGLILLFEFIFLFVMVDIINIKIKIGVIVCKDFIKNWFKMLIFFVYLGFIRVKFIFKIKFIVICNIRLLFSSFEDKELFIMFYFWKNKRLIIYW